MKTLLSIIIILTITLLSCSKSKDAITPINCDGLVTDTLGTNDNAAVYVSTAFTPNGDGLNDLWRAFTINCSSAEVTVYDENNTVVFTTTNMLAFWTPTAASNTSVKYYYRVQAVTSANHHIGQCGELYKLTCFPNSLSIGNLHFEDQLTQNGFTGVTAEHLAVCP